MADIKLETKLVGDITGEFFIPSYQRGYRWGEKEVKMMLRDILDNGDHPYSLQPVVVRKRDSDYELVDGQQRLTTLFLIYKYLYKRSGGFMGDSKFSLKFQTRDRSKDYLDDIDLSLRDENIDFWHIANAYETIEDFFKDKPASVLTTLNQYFDKNVKVIWYEIPQQESAVDLFTRLNIGKIPLTSSELVKALFLRKDADDILKHQDEISLQWDNIERDLHEPSLWAFLTNAPQTAYPTRIDLVLDLMAPKAKDRRDEYHTFFHFDNLLKSGAKLYDVWKEIQHTFLILKEWRCNHELYHKVGYLIATEYMSLTDIYHTTRNMRKSEFVDYLNEQIRNSINFGDKPYEELSYDKSADREMIERLLLLFNVESARTVDCGKQWFPFDKHKDAHWSLEHIHAQQSEGLDSNEKRALWIKAHIGSLQSFNDDESRELIKCMEDLLTNIEENPKSTKVRNQFEPIQQAVVDKLSEGGADYLHRIDNMALLDGRDNAALSNYVFDAKRNLVIEWDKDGKYIPYCTKMVFFKYYTPSNHTQLHFWGAKDREAYINAINHKLSPYMHHPITSHTNM